MRRSSDQLRPMANAIRALAMDAAEAAGRGHSRMPMGMADVSMPSWARFAGRDEHHRADLLPPDMFKVSIEAGTTFGPEAITGSQGLRFGIDSFGASVTGARPYEHFGLTPDAITHAILRRPGALPQS